MSKKHTNAKKKNGAKSAPKSTQKTAQKPETKISLTAIITAIVSVVLVLSIILTVTITSNIDPLAKYKEDTSTAEKDYYYVAMQVEKYGVIILKLDAVNAPITVANFVKLVREGFYDGLTFHRVIDDFMIQGGDPLGTGLGGSPNKIKGEFTNNGVLNTIKHTRGTISMARSGNSYNSASSQFFICNSDNVSFLDGNYAAFGQVVKGMRVVDKITRKTSVYGDDNGTIDLKDKQAVITKMMVIEYDK